MSLVVRSEWQLSAAVSSRPSPVLTLRFNRSSVVSQNKPLTPSTSLFVSELIYSVEVSLEVLLFKYLEENLEEVQFPRAKLLCYF